MILISKVITNNLKRFYLIDDGNKEKKMKMIPTLKTYSKNKKDYSACIICSEVLESVFQIYVIRVMIIICWNVMHNEDINDVNSANINLRPKGEFLNEDNTSSPRCLRHYYDSLGKGHYVLTACPESIFNLLHQKTSIIFIF